MDKCVQIPTWAKWLLYGCCWPAALIGCASTPPPCELFTVSVVQDQAGQHLVVLDEENAEKMIGLLKGLSEGKCRLTRDGEI